MKKIIFLTVTGLIAILGGQAQNTFPSSGNVGIGTTTPGNPLTVTGTNNVESPSIPKVLAVGDPSSPTKTISLGYSLSLDAGILASVHAATGWKNTLINPNGGNVGIGTTNPQSLLDIAGQIRIGKTGVAGRIDFARPGDGLYQGFLGWSTDEIFRQYFSGGSSSYRIASLINGQVTDILTALNNGNVGIGTTMPEVAFHVNGESRFNGAGWFSRNSNGAFSNSLYLGQLQGSDNPSIQIQTSDDGGVNRAVWLSNRWGHILRFQRQSPTGIKNFFEIGGVESSDHYLSIYSNDGTTQKISLSAEGISYIQGNVAIGTTNSQGYKLAVNGDAVFIKVKVKQYANWPDYVFHNTYRLPSLVELEQYIQQHQHLPDIPSATEVEKNGLDVGDNQAVLLKKIEELTLYIIEQNKKQEKLEKEVAALKEKINK
jgi:hypothetical protein